MAYDSGNPNDPTSSAYNPGSYPSANTGSSLDSTNTSNWPGVPYQPNSNAYPFNPTQTNQFGSALQDTLARLRQQQQQYAQNQGAQNSQQNQNQNAQNQQNFQNFQNQQTVAGLQRRQAQFAQNQNLQPSTYPSAQQLQQNPANPEVYQQFAQNMSGQNGQGGAQPGSGGQTGNTPYSQNSPSQFQTPSGQLDYNSLLRFYGINQQPNIRQSPFMSNDFMQAHPTLGGALNNAMFAAAGTQTERGPSGAGTGISNVLRGVAGVPQAVHEFQMQQQMAPFQMADAMAKLYGTTATAQEQLGRAQYYRDITPERMAAAQMRLQAAGDKRGQLVPGPDGKTIAGAYGNDGAFHTAQELGFPPGATMPSNSSGRSSSPYGKGDYTDDATDNLMAKRFGPDQSKWPAQVPFDIRTQAATQAESVYNPNRNVAPGGAGPRQGNAEITGIYDTWNKNNEAAYAAHTKATAPTIPGILTNPQIKAAADKNLADTLKRNDQFRDQSLAGQRQSQQSSAPANSPQRPSNVPSDYIRRNGPKGIGWYPPQ